MSATVLTLLRTATGYDRPVIGRLYAETDGEVTCALWTLELPWRENRRRESCIWPGPADGPTWYQVVHHVSPRFGHVLKVQNVPNRTHILFHAGNFMRDTMGCILPGKRMTDFNGDSILDVTGSRQALNQLREAVPEEGAKLYITWDDSRQIPASIEDFHVDTSALDDHLAGRSADPSATDHRL